MDHRIKMDDAPFTVAPLVGTRKADDCKTPMQPAFRKLEIWRTGFCQAEPKRMNKDNPNHCFRSLIIHYCLLVMNRYKKVILFKYICPFRPLPQFWEVGSTFLFLVIMPHVPEDLSAPEIEPYALFPIIRKDHKHTEIIKTWPQTAVTIYLLIKNKPKLGIAYLSDAYSAFCTIVQMAPSFRLCFCTPVY